MYIYIYTSMNTKLHRDSLRIIHTIIELSPRAGIFCAVPKVTTESQTQSQNVSSGKRRRDCYDDDDYLYDSSTPNNLHIRQPNTRRLSRKSRRWVREVGGWHYRERLACEFSRNFSINPKRVAHLTNENNLRPMPAHVPRLKFTPFIVPRQIKIFYNTPPHPLLSPYLCKSFAWTLLFALS